MGMLKRRVFVLALLPSMLAACGSLIGIDGITVDAMDATSVTAADGQAMDTSATQPPVDGSMVALPDSGIVPKRVFLTSTTVKGNIVGATGADSGLTGGDTICNQAAASMLDGGSWRAWLSVNGVDAIDRITFDGGYVRLDGQPVVPTAAQLVSGHLANPINVMENHLVASGPNPWVWTGTLSNGTKAAVTCTSWTSSASVTDYGVAGSFDQTDVNWTHNAGPGAPFPGFGCGDTVARLYCFEE